MTNKEILQADLLDILFENRNKEYGAYSLRRHYPQRLLLALGISLGTVGVLFRFGFSLNENPSGVVNGSMRDVVVTQIEFPRITHPPARPSVVKQATSTTYTDRVRIVPDNVEPNMPDQRQLDQTSTSNQTTQGQGPGNIGNTAGTSTTIDVKSAETTDAKPVEVASTDAQFPGGPEAFRKFLARWLVMPGDLEIGEKKVVLVRFMVDVMGNISKAEVMQSDGEVYTKEVLRVMAKMPKWIPATQNGIKMASWFVQPVSFIGIEQ